jgi:hypothetical protein
VNYRQRALLLVSVACFVVSLCSSTPGGDVGLGALIFGWLEVTVIRAVGPFVAFAWFANPLLILTWWLGTYPKSRASAIVTGGAALCLCLGYIAFGRVVVNDESGIPHATVSWTISYAFWLLSIVLALLRAVALEATVSLLARSGV